MNKENSLEEDVTHGTKEYPIEALYFVVVKNPRYPNGFYVERHWHHEIEIIKIEKGTYRLEVNLDTIYLKEGDLCFIHSEELHKLEGVGKKTSHQVLIFKPEIFCFTEDDKYQTEVIQPMLAGEKKLPLICQKNERGYIELETIFNQVFHLVYQKEKKGWYIQSKMQLLWMFEVMDELELFQINEQVVDTIKRDKIDRYKNIVRYIENNYYKNISLQELANQVNCNAQYLCHAFREIAGTSPIQYIINYRVECAKKMLKNTRKSVLEICYDCGFDNVSYFIRQFKARTGKTPKQYQKEMQV